MDGLIWAASMVALDASRRNYPVPRLALWSLGAGIVATVGANLAHGPGHGPVGALVSAWPGLALVGSFELLMVLIRKHHQSDARQVTEATSGVAPGLAQPGPPLAHLAPTLDQAVRDLHAAGRGAGTPMRMERSIVRPPRGEYAAQAGRDDLRRRTSSPRQRWRAAERCLCESIGGTAGWLVR